MIIPLFYFTIAFIYKHAPAIQEKWRLISPGTTLATILMIVLTFVFSFWVNNFGTIIRLWLHRNDFDSYDRDILQCTDPFIGFELNVSIHSLKEKAKQRKKPVI